MYCQCGCGQVTKVASYNSYKYGWIKGKHLTFSKGHNRTKQKYIVDKETGCWVWQLQLRHNGYGRIEKWTKDGKLNKQAHHYYYEQKYGPMPEGLVLDHLCRNRACVNPDHLEPVTIAENCRRGLGTKLSYEEVLEIRYLLRDTQLKIEEIAEGFNISVGAIYAIRRNKSWKDVQLVA